MIPEPKYSPTVLPRVKTIIAPPHNPLSPFNRVIAITFFVCTLCGQEFHDMDTETGEDAAKKHLCNATLVDGR